MSINQPNRIVSQHERTRKKFLIRLEQHLKRKSEANRLHAARNEALRAIINETNKHVKGAIAAMQQKQVLASAVKAVTKQYSKDIKKEEALAERAGEGLWSLYIGIRGSSNIPDGVRADMEGCVEQIQQESELVRREYERLKQEIMSKLTAS